MDETSFEAQMAKLRETFLERLAQTQAELDQLAADGRLRDIINIAHRLKGSAASYGFEALGAAAKKTEEMLAERGSAIDIGAVEPLRTAISAALATS